MIKPAGTPQRQKILVTGATGFVGSFLCDQLIKREFEVLGTQRDVAVMDSPFEVISTGEIGPNNDWSYALKDVTVVIHLAARVHVMTDVESEPLSAYRKVNVDGTLNLARQAVASGVVRFIYLSSIKVNGELTLKGRSFTASDVPNPQDAYSISKAEAEAGLRVLAAQSGMEIVIIRPPLVYGPNVKANFLRMLKWVQRGVPLPFGLIRNSRSLVGIDNLTDLIITCMTHPAAANQTFLVSDNQDVSTTELLKLIGQAFGKSARLMPVPASLMVLFLKMMGRNDLVVRLFGSLQVDIMTTRETLNWGPPLSLNEGLKKLINSM